MAEILFIFFCAHYQASEVIVIRRKNIGFRPFLTKYKVACQNTRLTSNLPQNMGLLCNFLILLTLTTYNFGQSGRNVKFFAPITKPAS